MRIGGTRRARCRNELLPVSGDRVNNFHGWGVSMYDALDTMWLMGLEDIFYDTVKDVAGETWDMAPVRLRSYPWMYL